MVIDEIKRQLFIDSEEVCGISMIDVYNAQDSCEESYSIGYNNALDDFVNEMKMKYPIMENALFTVNDTLHRTLDEIAEQLKVGGDNDIK